MYVVSYVLENIENKVERVVSPGFHFYFVQFYGLCCCIVI